MLDFLEVRVMMSKRGFNEAVVLFAFFFLVSPAIAATPWLHTDANLIKDPCGNVVVLRGLDTIDIGSVENWRGGVNALIDRVTNKNDPCGGSPGWYPRVIRLAVYPQDETATSGPWYFEPDPNRYYTDLLRPVVNHCKEKDLYVIIDWHYVGRNTYDKIPQTNAFWSYIAPRFANDSHVLFELFQEPLNTAGSTDTADWLSLRPDMQNWINIIRTSAFNNLILVSGPSWSQEIGPAAANPLTGDNIVMVAHIYPGHWLGGNQSWYTTHIDTCLTRYPVFASEWGFWMSGTNNNLHGTITNYGKPYRDFREARKMSSSAWVTDYTWEPQMFVLSGSNWYLRIGENEMGGFTKDMLYAYRDNDQPGEGNTIPPEAPTGLTSEVIGGTVSLNWDDNIEGDLYGYDIYRSKTSGEDYTRINLVRTKDSNYTDTNVAGNNTYYYVVTAVDTNFNYSYASEEVSAVVPPDAIPPAAPTGLAAGGDDGVVLLNWNNNAEVDINGYNVYRSTTSGSGYVQLNDSFLSSSDYTDYDVINGTTYYYVVTAVDTSSNESAYSSQVSAMPAARIDVNIIGSWVAGTTHSKVSGYYRGLVFIAHAEKGGTTAYGVNSVIYGGQSMTEINDINFGATSTRVCVAAYWLGEAGIAAATSGTFVPTWSDSPNDVSYISVFFGNVDQSAPIGAKDVNALTGNGTVTTKALATSSGDMVIVASACAGTGTFTLNNGFYKANEGGDVNFDAADGNKAATGAAETPSITHTSTSRKAIVGFVVQAMLNTAPSVPAGFAASADVGMITLDWNNNTEPDLAGYNVYRSTTSGSGYIKLNGTLLSSSNYIDTAVSNGTNYYYVVTAVDTISNESGYSSEISATPVIALGNGAALSEWWTGIPGADVNDLTSNVNYPDNPTGRELLTKLEGPVNWDDNYGARIRGYLHPVADGDYTFWIASDANSELWLSTDSDSANAVRIANVPGYTDSREWNKYPEQESAVIPLIGGQKYYIEVLHKEDTGNDNVAVAWQGPGITQQVIDGWYLSPCCLEFEDFAGLAAQWDRSDCNTGNDWCNGFDFNRDGSVLISDLDAFVEGWLLGSE